MREAANQKVAVITGASSGIGRATAHELAHRGWRLVLAARDTEALQATVEECDVRGAFARAVTTDVTRSEEVQRLAESTLRHEGRIDVWINNAGIGALGRYEETPLAAHEQVIQTDLLGYMRGAWVALPQFKRQGHGVLINLLSVGSWLPQPYAVAYAAAKRGLTGFSESLRGELTAWPDIHVCDIYPYFVDTPGMRHGGNYSGHQVRPLPPVTAPYRVARAICARIERPRPTTVIGASARAARLACAVTPGYSRLAGRFTERALAHSQPAAPNPGNLFRPPAEARTVEGGWRNGSNRPLLLLAAAAAIAAGAYLTRRSQHRHEFTSAA